MPRVAIRKKEYKASDLSKWIAAKMYETKLRQKQLADLIGISQPAFSHRLEKGQFDYKELLILFEKLEATDEEIVNLMKLSKKTKI